MEFLRNIQPVLVRFLAPVAAEFLGTFFLVLCGDGVMASLVLTRAGHISALLASLGWGLALMVGVALAGNISGGHVNPAVTLAFAVTKRMSWKFVLPYFLAQYQASFCAAALVYLAYSDGIYDFDGGIRQIPPEVNSTAEIFATYPKSFASPAVLFLDQVIGSALLLLVICAATDKKNLKVPALVQPFLIGLGLTVIALAFGLNCGAPLNPARDLSPRIFTAFAGWGLKTFRSYNWFWIPIIAPHLGGILGALLYDLFISWPLKSYSRLSEDLENGDQSEWEPPQVEVTKHTDLNEVFVQSVPSSIEKYPIESTASLTEQSGDELDTKAKTSTLSEG